MKLRQIFAGYQRGDECTGAVMLFGLQSSRLLEQKVIEDANGVYVFRGWKSSRK